MSYASKEICTRDVKDVRQYVGLLDVAKLVECRRLCSRLTALWRYINFVLLLILLLWSLLTVLFTAVDMLICFYLSDIANRIVSNSSCVVCVCVSVCLLSVCISPLLYYCVLGVSFCVLPNIVEINFIYSTTVGSSAPSCYHSVLIAALFFHRAVFVLAPSADSSYEYKSDKLAIVNSSGTVLWTPHGRLRSYCSIDLSSFPFDTQHCFLAFGPWSYDRSLVNISLNPATENRHRKFMEVGTRHDWLLFFAVVNLSLHTVRRNCAFLRNLMTFDSILMAAIRVVRGSILNDLAEPNHQITDPTQPTAR